LKKVAILWHMHQPDYRNPFTGEFTMPWVRLHAVSAYDDMAGILLDHPKMHCTINLVPCLLEQIEDYTKNNKSDPYLDMARKRAQDLSRQDRLFIVSNFFHLPKDTQVAAFPRYLELLSKRGDKPGDFITLAVKSFSTQDMRDLQTLFHLAWFGFVAREKESLLRDMTAKGKGFTETEKNAVLDVGLHRMSRLVKTYAELAESGVVEICTSPYCHPILPLLVDTNSAKRCMPQAPLPPRFSQPGDAKRQVLEGLDYVENILGKRPNGIWPSEGSVSPEVADIAGKCGLEWLVTDEGVLARSLGKPLSRHEDLYHPYSVKPGVKLLFRDRIVSDRIGFSYCRMEPASAARDLLSYVKTAVPDNGVITIVLDGENPWEHYPDRGKEFLNQLYNALSTDRDLEPVTVSTAARFGSKTLEHLHSGSWIESNFRVWIGDEETNKAWTLLGKVRKIFEKAKTGGKDEKAIEKAWLHLRAAEGSDWFWWLGDMFSSLQDPEFDRLFRLHLEAVLKELEEPMLPELNNPVSRSWARPPVEPATRLVSPKIDGTTRSYFEWLGCARYNVIQARSSMYKGENIFYAVLFGFDEKRLYIRLDPHTSDVLNGMQGRKIEIFFNIQHKYACQKENPAADNVGPAVLSYSSKGLNIEFIKDRKALNPCPIDAAALQVIELSISFHVLGAGPGDKIGFFVRIVENETEIDRLPPGGFLDITIPGDDFMLTNWSV